MGAEHVAADESEPAAAEPMRGDDLDQRCGQVDRVDDLVGVDLAGGRVVVGDQDQAVGRQDRGAVSPQLPVRPVVGDRGERRVVARQVEEVRVALERSAAAADHDERIEAAIGHQHPNPIRAFGELGGRDAGHVVADLFSLGHVRRLH